MPRTTGTPRCSNYNARWHRSRQRITEKGAYRMEWGLSRGKGIYHCRKCNDRAEHPRRMMFRETDDDLNIPLPRRGSEINPQRPSVVFLFSFHCGRIRFSGMPALSVNHRLFRPSFSFKGILSPGHRPTQYRIVTMNHWNLHSPSRQLGFLLKKKFKGQRDVN